MLGDGVAVEPEEGKVYAPADGTVLSVFDTKHAVCFASRYGTELLIHIGIDTVDMKGDGFEYLVSEGQKVSAGTPLIRFDRAKIKAAGHPDVTVCVITEEGNAQNIQLHTGIQVKAKETKVADWT